MSWNYYMEPLPDVPEPDCYVDESFKCASCGMFETAGIEVQHTRKPKTVTLCAECAEEWTCRRCGEVHYDDCGIERTGYCDDCCCDVFDAEVT